jgi:hypothetical protein
MCFVLPTIRVCCQCPQRSVLLTHSDAPHLACICCHQQISPPPRRNNSTVPACSVEVQLSLGYIQRAVDLLLRRINSAGFCSAFPGVCRRLRRTVYCAG